MKPSNTYDCGADERELRQALEEAYVESTDAGVQSAKRMYTLKNAAASAALAAVAWFCWSYDDWRRIVAYVCLAFALGFLLAVIFTRKGAAPTSSSVSGPAGVLGHFIGEVFPAVFGVRHYAWQRLAPISRNAVGSFRDFDARWEAHFDALREAIVSQHRRGNETVTIEWKLARLLIGSHERRTLHVDSLSHAHETSLGVYEGLKTVKAVAYVEANAKLTEGNRDTHVTCGFFWLFDVGRLTDGSWCVVGGVPSKSSPELRDDDATLIRELFQVARFADEVK